MTSDDYGLDDYPTQPYTRLELVRLAVGPGRSFILLTLLDDDVVDLATHGVDEEETHAILCDVAGALDYGPGIDPPA